MLSAHPGHVEPTPVLSAGEVAAQYLELGFLHILPGGLDHVLFVLSLFFSRASLKSLLVQLTSFTLAHSLTLAFAALGWVRLPSEIIEPLIAASIAYVALENLLFGSGGAHRPLIVFGFGLLHGLGFAGVLGEVGLPSDHFLLALLTFNIGVELGQIAVIAIAAAASMRWVRRSWYESRVMRPISFAIALFGLYWLFERTLGSP